MNDVDVKLLEKSFKRYYLSHISEIPIPMEITKREFGYKKFTGGMIRHIPYGDEKALRHFWWKTLLLSYMLMNQLLPVSKTDDITCIWRRLRSISGCTIQN